MSRRTILTTAIALSIALMLSGSLYFRFVERKIFEESTSHLTEIYAQVNSSFNALVSQNWGLLDDWGHLISHLATTQDSRSDELQSFLLEIQKTWGFTDFYFLDGEGNYITAEGEQGHLDLGPQIEDLMVKREHVVVDGTLPEGEALTVFASPAADGAYQGFRYSAIAISYNSVDMSNALDVASFEGESECYVVYPDGRVLISASNYSDQPYNYQVYLSLNAVTTTVDMDQVWASIANGETGIAEYYIGNTSYYLSYQPVGLHDWTLLGIVPTDVVNASMNQIQWTTLAVFAGTFALISAAGIAFMVHLNRRKLDTKATELKYREELFGVLADNTNDIFVMFSSDTLAVRYISPNVERLIGITAEAVKQDVRIISRTAVDPRCNLINDDMHAIAIGDYAQTGCERIHQGTGERRWYLETLYHLSIDGTEKYILVLSDRTEERLGNQILEQALDLAKSSNEAKGRFLAKMSHDIRTPINAITGLTAIAQKSIGDDAKIASCLEVIERSTIHLLGLINDVLDMSKIESGQLSLRAQACSIDEILEDIEPIISPQAQAKNQILRIKALRIRHRALMCDKLRICQVLLNLLSNAVKYTPEGGSISVTVTELSQESPQLARMQFTVSDNGIGMPAEFLDSIFEPFVRSSQNDVANIQGSGLGMPITKAIVDAMGGTMAIRSDVGKGSTFTVTLDLPIADATHAPALAEETPAAPSYSFAGKHFLIVEDNEINAEILKELLALEGAAADWAENGRLGVKAFESKPPHYYDAVLMDVMMPEMNGCQAALAIRDLACEGKRPDAASITIVALTANAFADDVQAALESGMDAHVAKPVRMDELGRTLAEVCTERL